MQAVVESVSRRVLGAVLPHFSPATGQVSGDIAALGAPPRSPGASAATSPLQGALTPPAPQRVAVAQLPATLGVTQSGTLTAGRTTFARCRLADLQPGDITFQYLSGNRNFRQFWINFGGQVSNLWRPWNRADASVMHAFVVTGVDPARHAIYGVDAAGGDLEDISEVELNFETGARVVPGAQYFFYRPTSPAVAQYIVSTAINWASPGLHNFSIPHAVRGPFQSFRPTRNTWQRALFFLQNAGVHAPLVYPGTHVLYKMMCSEFVANVCQAATLLAWRETHPEYQFDTAQLLRGLYDGATGDAFAVNAAGITPPLLHLRMEQSAGMRPVGFVNDQGE